MAEHKHPNYMAIFYYLAILTAVELGVIFLPIPKIVIAALLCVFAVWKAALVAMYFMHLKYEGKLIYLIFLVPLALCVILVVALMPDLLPIGSESLHPFNAQPMMHPAHR